MERLTNKREADAQREEYERRLANGYPRNIPEERFLRLAAYEDTGLTPKEVTALGELFDYALKESKTLTEQLTLLKHIRELAEADKDGRVVVLPCKPGAEVWATRHDKVWPMYFVAPTLSAVCPDMQVHCQKDTCAGGPCKAYFGTDAREFGKTVFLTREEAEKALEERGKA